MMISESKVKAVILAAGKSSKFFPPLYDKPKGLFVFKGEVLIERQIRQLQEAGINDITVVLGYEKEKFFYLEDKFNVDLVVNTKYADESNLTSLYLVKDKIKNAYICCADHWYEASPFSNSGYMNSVRLIQYQCDAKQEFVVEMDNDGRLSNLLSGASSGLCMTGYAFFTSDFSNRFINLYELEKFNVGVKSLFWEEFWSRHSDELPLFGESLNTGFIEFDSLSDLQKMDGGVLENVSPAALKNIVDLLQCDYGEINEIHPLNKGLTNVSFSFVCKNQKYVYRHPGASSSNLVNRDVEVCAQNIAVDLGIDSSVIAIDPAGWKLSKFVESCEAFDYDNSKLLRLGIEQIIEFHKAANNCGVTYEVNLLREGERLIQLAANKKGTILEDVRPLKESLKRLWHYFELDGWNKVLCHNDTYAVNWIVGKDKLCLIDWEYAGLNDPVNDIATLIVRDGLSEAKTEEILQIFFGDKPTFEQRRHSYACFALCGWYWYCWALFKDTLGEDGFFMLPSWRAIKKYLPIALKMYEQPNIYIDKEQ